MRQSAQIPPDVRAYAQVLFTSLPTELLIPYIHPNFYSLHDMPPEVSPSALPHPLLPLPPPFHSSTPPTSPLSLIHALTIHLTSPPPQAGTPGPTGHPLLPPRLPLSSEKFERHGLYLIEDGQSMYLWVGRDAVPQLMIDVFGFPDYGVLRSGKVRFTPSLSTPPNSARQNSARQNSAPQNCISNPSLIPAHLTLTSLQTSLPPLDNPFSQRLCALITHIRTTLRHGVYHPHLYVVKEDGDDQALKMRALSAMVYDRNESALPSYGQWVGQLRDKVSGGW